MSLVQEMENNSKSRTSKDLLSQNPIAYGDREHLRPDIRRLRVIPRDKAFYMSNPPHEEIVRRLNGLLQLYIKLPTLPQEEYRPARWMSIEEYRVHAGGARLRPKHYREFVQLATRLDMIDPQLMPPEVEQMLDRLKVSGSEAVQTAKKIDALDEQGRATAVGRRKTASARVIVTRAREGTVGTFMINGKSLVEYFSQIMHRAKILYPLNVIEAAGDYNVFATVHGGGLRGQADAVSQGLALALTIHNPLLAGRLKTAGCTKRDIRIKERKKPGLAKARKRYTWVKR